MADKSDNTSKVRLVIEDPIDNKVSDQNYERMDPTNHPKIETDKNATEKELDRKLMSKVNDLKGASNEIGFGFRTDIENLHQFYDDTLQEFLRNVDSAAKAEFEDKIRAKQVEETRKKMQELANERAKIERALKEAKEKAEKEKKDAESRKKATEAAKQNQEKKDDNQEKKDDDPDVHENKSQLGKSKVPNKQAVSSEPIGRPGGDVPDDKKQQDAVESPGVKEPLDPTLPIPAAKPKPDPRKSVYKQPDVKTGGEKDAASDKKADHKEKELQEANEIEKKKQQEMQTLKDLEANLVDSLEQGMSRFTVIKLSLEKAEEMKSSIPKITSSRYSSDGRFALAVTDIGGIFLFDTGSGIKKQDVPKSAEIDRAKLNAHIKEGSKIFRHFHVLTKLYPNYGSGYGGSETALKLDAAFSPDNTEIIIFDCYTQTVLVYLVNEVIEHGFLVHQNYEAIRQVNNHATLQAKKESSEHKKAYEYRPITNRKEGEPRYIIPLRWFYEYKPGPRRDDRKHEIKFMHFEKVVAGDQYFNPVDQDTLVIGTDDYVCRILFARFNEPLIITPKNDRPELPEVILHQNKSYSEIFDKYYFKDKGATDFSYAFTQGNLFYTQLKQKNNLMAVTLYKFNWERFIENDIPRIRLKRLGKGDSLPFVMVVSRIQISSNFTLFPNTLSATGQQIYAFNSKTNDIRVMDLETGNQQKLLNLPPNRAGVSHMIVRHHGKFLLLVDTDGWFDIYNYNNELVEKGTKYSQLYSFFGVVEPIIPTKFFKEGVVRSHDYKLAELLPKGTGVFFFNNLNLYHFDLDLPESRVMPAISKVTKFCSMIIFNRRLDHTYEILQLEPGYSYDDGEDRTLQRIVDFSNWKKTSNRIFKPVTQRTAEEYGEEPVINYSDLPSNLYYVTGSVSFMKKMKEVDSNQYKQLAEINLDLIQINCLAIAPTFEYEVSVPRGKSKINFKLILPRNTDEDGHYVIKRLNEKYYSTLKIDESPVWKLPISDEYNEDVYTDQHGQDPQYESAGEHLIWNQYQGMYNMIPINDDGSLFLAPVKPYLKVMSVDKGPEKKGEDPAPAFVRNLPLLGPYGAVFWLSESLVGAILRTDLEIQTEKFVEWFPKGTKLKKGMLIFDLNAKEDPKWFNRSFKIRDAKDEELLDFDLENVQVYPSGFKDLRFIIVCDELLTFDTQRQVFLYNTANVRERQTNTIQKGPFQFLPNYVYKSSSFLSSRNNATLALTALRNPSFVRLFSLPKLELLEEITLGLGASNQTVRMCFSHDSKYFLVMTTNMTISVYSIILEKFVEPIILPENIFKSATVMDINLVQESRFVEVAFSSKNHVLIYRIPFYPEPRDLLLGALRKNFRSYHHANNSLGSSTEHKRIASEVAALISLQFPHQICLDNTLLKILCSHTAKEPLEAYLNSLKDKEIIFKASQLDILASIHEQIQEDNENDFLQLNQKKQGQVATNTKSNLTNHVLNSFIDAIGVVHEGQKRLPEISAKTIIKWLKSKSLSRRYRTKLIELITFEPLNTLTRGALQSDTGMVALVENRVNIEKTIKFVDTWTKSLMDPESANIDEFDSFITGIDFDLRNGSEFSLNYFTYLQEVSDEDLQLKYMGIIYYKWSQILYPATIYSFLYWILNGLITAFMGFSYNSFGLGWAIIVLNVIFISYEVKGISYNWKESWKDPWNYYDTISHGFTMIAVMILFKNPTITYEMSWLRIISFVLISFRGVMMLRIFSGTRYLLVMMLEVFNDMVAFLSIFFWMTFAYWFMCLTRPSLYVGGADLELKAAIGQSLDIAFSNFNAGGLNTINLVTTVIGQILIALIMLNYLISIVSKTSERISEERELYDIKMLLEIIREFDLVFNGFRSSKEARNARYLILRPRPTVDIEVKDVLNLFEEEKARLEAVFRQEVSKIEETVVESIEHFSSKIAETQKEIVELLKTINNKQVNTSKKEVQDFINQIKGLPQVVELDNVDQIQSEEKKVTTKQKEDQEEEDDLYYHESSDDVVSTDQEEGSMDSESEAEEDDDDNEGDDSDEYSNAD
jgi:hypothetical protein